MVEKEKSEIKVTGISRGMKKNRAGKKKKKRRNN